jgi:hypothetical protein
MKLFNLFVILLLFFSGCNDNKKSKTHICPQCNMPLPKSNINTSILNNNHYFDDIGCLILWSKENNIDLKQAQIQVYTTDTKKYLNPFKLYFTINSKTPMHYGFEPFENKCQDCIKFDEVIIRMLRGEHLANPKIRKQILGY